MSLLNECNDCNVNNLKDFSNVGGLHNHLKILKELIIYPLIHADIYRHFQVKQPRGVLFYGPPGTGKTLVAGALVNEINKQGIGKVSFYYNKGSDIFDKWFGESEKKLQAIFDEAAKTTPAIIFFDEIDALAPIRSNQHDHIHNSIVATLLSSMDGLDSVPGIVIIGATNCIENIDPALRRSGRFDQELYFPMPTKEARKDILRVMTLSWTQRPSSAFLDHLADITNGFCGADLQTLCSEAVKRCTKRFIGNTNKISRKRKINSSGLKVEENDFIEASLNLLPRSKHLRNNRDLSNIIKPLLERQLNKIMESIRIMWPHFLDENTNYNLSDARYAGRLILKCNHIQSLNMHIIPAILHKLEHLQDIVSIETIINTNHERKLHYPSIILMTRIDEMWDTIHEYDQNDLLKQLEDIHSNLPVFFIASCKKDIPEKLENFFYNNSTLIINVENPNEEERQYFLAPLFFSANIPSLYSVLQKHANCQKIEPSHSSKSKSIYSVKKKSQCSDIFQNDHIIAKRMKYCNDNFEIDNTEENDKFKRPNHLKCKNGGQYFATILSELVTQQTSTNNFSVKTIMCDKPIKTESHSTTASKCKRKMPSIEDMKDDDGLRKIYDLWKYTTQTVSKEMNVGQLELLYDVISVCINLHKESFSNLALNLEECLGKIDKTS